MRQSFVVAGALSASAAAAVVFMLTTTVQTQSAPLAQSVDFVRDVQPIFRQSCYGCHGPSQQMNGFRLDRRRDALRGGTIAQIGPGNSAGSRLYLRLVGSDFGQQMPPTGALPAEKVAVIKAWIDQGAHWPDEASGDVAALPVEPAVTPLVTLLRDGDLRGFTSRVGREPKLANARGPGGATPLMYAALYAPATTVRDLLSRGADVNARNDAGATPLMWAVPDLEKTRALIDRGADVNARSADGRTALMIAAGARASAATVKLLLDKGAKVDIAGSSPFGPGVTALTEAAIAGNEEVFRLLVNAGADLKSAGPPGLGLSLAAGCMACAEMMMKAFPTEMLTSTMMMGTPPLGPSLGIPMFMARGASIDGHDESGRSILMLAAASDTMPVDSVKALLARNVDVNARTAKGDTALNLARRHGETPIVKMLLAAGAKDEPLPPAPTPQPAHSAREAVERALPLLQKAHVTFLKKSGCVSCHNNSLASMTFEVARQQGYRIDAAVQNDQARKIGTYLESWRERAIQGIGIPGDSDTMSYILLGLAADGYRGDIATDAQAHFIRRAQMPDGRWRVLANRPPIESSDFEVTAASMRALQTYGPPAKRAEYDKSIAAGAAWLRTATPRVTEDRTFQLLGLHWANAPKTVIEPAGRALVAEQRADGGWAQLPSMSSDAYATGQALVALVQSGVMTTADPVYRRGVDFLLKTQLADGSWFVRTRAIALQPIFDSDFPHGPDAFISAAATNWAAMALALGPTS
ncbi:MAG TPA: ankyrin repeat domain-containing protein [Vicinamibacterales bacterium]|nr:ankyrin repeat domain-containing protein [Vicinamibacterales bacterium]